mgnify:CR=1 FL=1
MDGVPKTLPSLTRAQRLQEKASLVGFDWDNIEPIWDKLYEEIEECCAKATLITSSTSGIMPSKLQERFNYPDRFYVGHPFNPVYLLPLVEIVGGGKTSKDTIKKAKLTPQKNKRIVEIIRGAVTLLSFSYNPGAINIHN